MRRIDFPRVDGQSTNIPGLGRHSHNVAIAQVVQVIKVDI